MNNLAIVVLAAGKGTRMGANLPKVLFRTNQNSLLEHVLTTAAKLEPERLILVTGYEKEQVENAALSGKWIESFTAQKLKFAYQKEQLGTGHAVKSAIDQLAGFTGTVLILYGDVPLIELQTLQSLLDKHHTKNATLSLIVLKGHLDNAYGKIVRDQSNNVQKIIEHRDCSEEQKMIDETNVGIYAVDSAFLIPALEGLSDNNQQKEFYLTDIVERAVNEGQTICNLILTDHDQVQGVNTPWDLQVINRSLRLKTIKNLANKGVIFEDPDSVFIDQTVSIAAGVKIGPLVILKGQTTIAAGSVLEGNCFLNNCSLAENVHLRMGVRAEDTTFGKGSGAGPFAHFRSKSQLEDGVHIGNFVEVKNSSLGKGSKAGHLAYLGDAEIGAGVNIGAGTIIANYDGANKHKTVICDNSFVGSNSVLVAPIELGENSTVGAGSVLSKNIEAGCLAVTRAPVKIKRDWVRPKKLK